jgi:DNA-binding response OmpR family regulator
MHEDKLVLVVEDDEFYSDIYKRKFKAEGISAIVVGNGTMALESARTKKPKLVLLDGVLPGKDGFEILKDLKADADIKDIKVIMLSNLSQDEDIQRAKKMGAIDYIVKANISMEEIVKRVKKELE